MNASRHRRHPQNNLSNPAAGVTTREHDQFYTSRRLIEHIAAKVRSIIPAYDEMHWVDFSAGTNEFLHVLAPTHSTSFDIAPLSDDCVRRDWFTVSSSDIPSGARPIAVCLNPPFGVRTVLARRFLRHALDTLAPQHFVLVAPLSAWTFLRGKYHTLHVEVTPRNSFYTLESDGERRAKNMRVTIVVLERRVTEIALPRRVQTSTEHVERARRTPNDDPDFVFYDMFIGSNGDAMAGRTIFVRDDVWSLYRNGVCTDTNLREPSLCVTTGMFSGIRFRHERVSPVAMHEVARLMPTMLPSSLYFTTPASISLRDMLAIIERILRERLLQPTQIVTTTKHER